MSADCLYILRNVSSVSKLKCALSEVCRAYGNGLLFNPVDALIACKQVEINKTDFAFTPTYSDTDMTTDLLISHDNQTINGNIAVLPLYRRLEIVQILAQVCLPYCTDIDIYLSDDNPYLPDYAAAELKCNEIAEFLYRKYQCSTVPYAYIPDVHLHIAS